jgi:hypothetical protein
VDDPGNRAIWYSPKISHGLFRVTAVGEAPVRVGEFGLPTLADNEKCGKDRDLGPRRDVDPQVSCAHPFAGFDFRPLLPAIT